LRRDGGEDRLWFAGFVVLDGVGMERQHMNASSELKELATALAKAQGEFQNVTRGERVDTGKFKYTFADLASILDSTRVVLAKYGLSISTTMVPGEETMVTLETVLMHSSGQWLSSITTLPAGQGPQAFGSAVTYGRRYAITAILNLATEDDDGQAAQQTHVPKAAHAYKKPFQATQGTKPEPQPVPAAQVVMETQESFGEKRTEPQSAAFDLLMKELSRTPPGDVGRMERMEISNRVLLAREADELLPGQLEILRAMFKTKESGK
jgi:hypothetical protein